MPSQPDIRAAQVSITESSLVADLKDGRSLSVPLSWFPDLEGATAEQLADHRLIGDGVGIHWETLGIDLSIPGLMFDNLSQADDYEKPPRVSYHVVPTDGEWRLKRQGEKRYTSFATKSEAIRAGVKEARSHAAGQLIIHTQDGRFQEERTYGYDPPESAG